MSATKECAGAEVRLADRVAVNEADAAKLLGFKSPDTLKRKRTAGTGPAYVRVGGPLGPVRYLVEDLRAWMASQRHVSRTAEIAANGIGGDS